MKSIYRMTLVLLLCCVALFISLPANALDSAGLDTTIVFTNSTPNATQVSLEGNAQFSQLSRLATRSLAIITRTEGTQTESSIHLSSDAYQLKLQTDNKDLLFGAETDDITIPPQNNTTIQRYPTLLSDDACTLAFNGSDLDYTLVGLNNLQPESVTQEIFAPRSLIDNLWGEWDLSDNYAARGEFTYPSSATPERTPFPYIGDVVHLKTKNGNFMRTMGRKLSQRLQG